MGTGKNSGFGNGFWEWLHSFLPVTFFFRLGFSSSAVVLFDIWFFFISFSSYSVDHWSTRYVL